MRSNNRKQRSTYSQSTYVRPRDGGESLRRPAFQRLPMDIL